MWYTVNLVLMPIKIIMTNHPLKSSLLDNKNV